MANLKTIYLCYFGLREPLVQTQVLPYLREIQKDGVAISILTFEPNPKKNWTAEQIETERKKLADEGIEWSFLNYHKRPSAPGTLLDILNGAFFVWKKIRRERIDVIHARIHVPAMMGVIAKKLAFGKKPKLLFDIRGFFPEEYTDAGIWKPNGWLYKSVKTLEKWLFHNTDGFVVLTEKARKILFPESAENGFDKFGRPVEVIPCCIDSRRFSNAALLDRTALRRNLGLDEKTVFVYVGSFGGWYLSEEMLEFFARAYHRIPDAFIMILTQRDVEKVKNDLIASGVEAKDFLVESVAPAEIPKYLKAADVSLSFIKACYSKQSSSPTKIAEYLASGLPIISNSGVGDLDEMISGERVGLILEDLTGQSFDRALNATDDLLAADMPEHCRKTAYKLFDLEAVGGARYRSIYRKLLR